MVNALKRLDKKFLILFGIIIGLPLIIIIFLAVFQGCQGSKISHEKYENKMILAAEKYVDKLNNPLDLEGEYIEIKLSTLIDKGYIKDTQKLIGDSSCDGFVTVRRNGASIESNEGGYLNYLVSLKCDDYKTIHLVDKLKEDLTTSEAGLYLDGNGYVFKGKKVNNYVRINEQDYVVMSIDENNILKLVKIVSENVNRMWDNKFNIDTNSLSGKNIYKDSLILEYLLMDYDNNKRIKQATKKYIVAKDVCIGKRDPLNYSIDSSLDCSEKLEKQVVSLLNISDYAKASLDANCVNLNSRSCNNYNYLYEIASNTWTLNSSVANSYDVLYISNGMLHVKEARKNNKYNIVIYIDGNQLYQSGKGTSSDPYVIE